MFPFIFGFFKEEGPISYPDTLLVTWEWRNDIGNIPGCCNYDYVGPVTKTSDTSTETVWVGGWSGTDDCGWTGTISYTVTLVKSTGISTVYCPNTGPTSKSGLYGTYPLLGPFAGPCGNVTATFIVTDV